MNEVLVSVIIPTYNREKVIKRSIDSVLNQTINNLEVIIVDDRSTDNTKEIIEEYQKKDNRLKYIVNENSKGPAGARNMGLKVACGKYIAFLDSDDEWEKFHIEESLNLIKKTNSTASFAYWFEKHNDKVEDLAECEEIKVKLDDAIKYSYVKDYGDYFCLENNFLEYSILSYFYCYHINTLVMERENLKKTGIFKEDLFTSEDVDLIVRIMDKCKVVIDKKAHFTYYDDAENNLYSYINRDNIRVSDIINDREIVRRLTLDGENKNKMRKYLKDLVYSSDNIHDKEKCIRVIDKRIEEKYYTLAFINGSGKNALKYAKELFLVKKNFKNLIFLCRSLFSSKKEGIYNFDFN